MSDLAHTILDSITPKIDPAALLRLIGQKPDQIRFIGTIIKTSCHGFCGLPKPPGFPTIVIDTSRRTFQCTVPTCPAHRGGQFPQLFFMHRRTEDLQTVLELARALDIRIERDLMVRVEAYYREAIALADHAGDHEKVRRIVDEALLSLPTSVEMMLAGARAAEALSHRREAAELYLRAARERLATGDSARASVIVIEEVLRIGADESNVVLLAAETLDKLGQHDEAMHARLSVVAQWKAAGRPEDARKLLRALSTNRPCAEVSLALGDILLQLGDKRRAEESLEDARDRFARASNAEGELTALRALATVHPENVAIRSRIVEILRASGQTETLARELAILADLRLKAGDAAPARRLLDEAISLDPANLLALEALARLSRGSGNHADAAAYLRSAAQVYLDLGLDDEAERCLADALAASPGDADALASLCGLLTSQSRTVEVEARLQAAAAAIAPDAFSPLLIGLMGRLRADTAFLAVAGALLSPGATSAAAASGRVDELARSLLASNPAAALQLARVDPAATTDTAALVLFRDAAIAAGAANDEQLATLRLYELHREAGRTSDAESVLQETLARHPKAPLLTEALAALRLSQGRHESGLHLLRDLLTSRAREGEPLRERVARRLLDAEKGDVAAHLVLAETLKARGNASDAAAHRIEAARSLIAQGSANDALQLILDTVAMQGAGSAILRDAVDLLRAHFGKRHAINAAERLLVALLSERASPDVIRPVFRELIDLDPERVDSYLMKARFLQGLQLAKDVAQILDRAEAICNRRGDDRGLQDVLTIRAEMADDGGGARARLAEVLFRQGEREAARLQLVESAALAAGSGDHQAAVHRLRRAIKDAPAPDPALSLTLATYQASAGDTADAVDTLRTAAAALRSERRTDDVEAALRRAVELSPDDVALRLEWAASLLEDDDALAAAREYAAAASALHSAGEHPRAAEAARTALRIAPDLRPARATLLETLLASGDTDGFRIEAADEIASLQAAGELGHAADLAVRLAAIEPDDDSATISAATMLAAAGRASEAAALLTGVATRHLDASNADRAWLLTEPLLQVAPDSGDAALLAARVAIARSDPPAAARILHQHARASAPNTRGSFLAAAMALVPDDAELCTLAADDLVEAGRVLEAGEIAISLAIRLRGGSAEAALGLLERVGRAGAPPAYYERAAAAAAGLSDAPEAAAALYEKAASLYRRSEQPREAVRCCDAGLALDPENAELTAMRFALLDEVDPARAATVALAQARQMFQSGDGEGAMEFLGRRFRRHPTSAVLAGELARLHELTGERITAARVWFAHGQALDEAGASADSERAYAQALRYRPEDGLARAARARVLGLLGQGAEAADEGVTAAEALHAGSSHRAGAFDSLAAVIPWLPGAEPACQRAIALAIRMNQRDQFLARVRETAAELERNASVDAAASLLRTVRVSTPAEAGGLFEEERALLQRHDRARELVEVVVEEAQRRRAAGEDQSALTLLDETIPAVGRRQGPLLAAKAELLMATGRTGTAEFQSTVGALLQSLDHPNAPRAPFEVLDRAAAESLLSESQLEHAAQIAEAAGDRTRAAAYLSDLGGLLLARGESSVARERFAAASALDPSNPAVARGLFQSALGVGDIAAISGAAAVYADALEKAGRADEAHAVYREWSAAAPADKRVLDLWAESLRRAGRNDAAAELYTRIAASHREAGRPTAEMAALERAHAIRPEDLVCLRRLAALCEAEGQAERSLRFRVLVAERLAALGEFESTVEACESILSATPGNTAVRLLRASALESVGKTAEAIHELREIASLRERDGKLDAAVEMLQRALALGPGDHDARLQLSVLLERLGRRDDALESTLAAASALERENELERAMQAVAAAMRLRSESPAVHERRASVLWRMKDNAGAQREYEWLVERYLETSDFERAVKAAERCTELAPGASPPIVALARVLHSAGDLPGARRAFERAAKVANDAGDRLAATAALEAGRELIPNDMVLRRELAALYFAQGRRELGLAEFLQCIRVDIEDGRIEDAEKSLAAMYESEGQNLDFRRSVALVWEQCRIPEMAAREMVEIARIELEKLGPEVALASAREAQRLRPNDPAVRQSVIDALTALGRSDEAATRLIELAEMQVARERLPEAIEALEGAIRLQPREERPREMLAGVLRRTGDGAALSAALRELAELLISKAEYERAVEHLRELLRIRPDDTRARSYYIDSYRRVGPEVDLVEDYLKLAALQARRGAVNEAQRLYEKVLQLAPGRTDVRETFVEFLTRHGEPRKAVDESLVLATDLLHSARARDAQRVLSQVEAQATGNPDYHHLAGRVHNATNARGSALRELKRAAELFRAAKEFDRAREILREIMKLDPQNASVADELVSSFIEAGRPDDAIETALQLATVYERREMPDLAEQELRRVLGIRHDMPEVWARLIKVRERFCGIDDLVPDLLGYADALLLAGRYAEALEQISRAVEAAPRNIDARRRYVRTYLERGSPSDIAEDIIALGDLLTADGHVEEAVEWYGRLLTEDPHNTAIRDKLSETQSRKLGEKPQMPIHELRHRRPSDTRNRLPDLEMDISGTQARMMDSTTPPVAAAGFLGNVVDRIDEEEQQAAITQVINNYREILAVNAQNAAVRVKLADVLEHIRDFEAALNELTIASEIFFNKGELSQCIAVCERILGRNPRDQKVRDRLTKAVNKRDAFKAIESAILFTDRPADQDDTESKF